MDLTGLAAIIGVFGIPMLAIWTGHQRKMAELRLQSMNMGDASVRSAIDGLRDELRALRDTTMQYDLSFDAALQRMDARMGSLERKVQAIEARPETNVRIG
jgi:hypothetical protein